MTDILPTHTCFDDAVQNAVWLMRTRGRDLVDRLRIAHAVIAPDGKTLAHAWIEMDGHVFFSGILQGQYVMVEVDLVEYYRQSRIKRLKRYSLFEAYSEERRTGEYGPWDPQIKSHCT